MSTYSEYTQFRFWSGRVWLRLGLTLSGALALFGVLFLVLAEPVYATIITVNTIADDNVVNGNCTLREAIKAANDNIAVDACVPGVDGPDTIVFDVDGTITLSSTLTTIVGGLIIDGSGRNVTISGNNAVRVFYASAPLTLKAITVTLGKTTDGNGGGIYASKALTLTNVNVLSNTAQYIGGGVWVGGVVTINDSTFQNNRANNNSGGLYASTNLTIANTNFISNIAQYGGGGMVANGTATINGGLFQNNWTNTNGGGLRANGDVTIIGAQFIANTGVAGGGGLFLNNGVGNGQVVNALFARNTTGNGAGTAIRFASSGALTILHTTIASPTQAVGPALFCLAGTVSITDTIIASHTIGMERSGGTMSENFNLFFGNTTNISGTVTSGGNSLNGLNPRFASPAGDDYHLTASSSVLDLGANVGVTTDFEGDPRPYGNGFDIGYDEFTHLVRFSAETFSVNENAGSALITVTLNAPSPLTTTVVITSADGTATAGVDYTAISQTLTIVPGAVQVTITVGISDDLISEANETVLLSLGSPTDASLIGVNPATLTIVDDEPVIRLVQFSTETFSVNENAGPALITVTLTPSSPLTTTVVITSADGTATAGVDYTAISQTLTIVPGAAQVTFTVGISDDLISETNETVLLSLGSPTNASLGEVNSATLTIVDDKPAIYLPLICKP